MLFNRLKTFKVLTCEYFFFTVKAWNMWRPLIIFTVFSNILVFTNGAPKTYSLDALDDLLNALGDKTSASSESVSDSSGDGGGYMRTLDVVNLLQKSKNNNQLSHNAKERNKLPPSFKINPKQLTQSKLEELKRFVNNIDPPPKRAKKRVTPNRLLSPIELDNDERMEQTKGLNDYAKIYVVLDSKAVQSSRNKAQLGTLLKKIFSLSNAGSKKLNQENNKRYKGFQMKHGLMVGRRKRDSSEAFMAKSKEDDYKPKRSRGEQHAGLGGRTAIPYMRHRVDIYERDG